MEIVDGEPIDVYCDRRGLSVVERVRLVLSTCDALAYAHRNLVVHRDLKPSNLLVTADGQPKFLDFGIAKELEVGTVHTRTGQQPFTLAYASPEQVRGGAMTTAVDIYSLGVLLYRLLCGQPPYELGDDTFENFRRICEEEPPPPSSRAEAADRVRCLRGDLDSIVLKTLAKDPGDRYVSMGELAEDLRRHLEGQPVRARSATLFYRTSKFLLRHHRRLAAAALVVVLAGSFGVTKQRDARRVARLSDAVSSPRQKSSTGVCSTSAARPSETTIATFRIACAAWARCSTCAVSTTRPSPTCATGRA